MHEELEVEVREQSESGEGDAGLDRRACEQGLAGHAGPHLSFSVYVGFELAVIVIFTSLPLYEYMYMYM